MGYLRLILSLVVMLQHMGINPPPLTLGVVAVTIFYLLAGYVSAKLLNDVYHNNVRRFIVDRLTRLMPLYYLTLFITVLFVAITEHNGPVWDGQTMLYNFLLLPLNYYMYIHTVVFPNQSAWFVPTAWSLSLEVQAYIVLALLLRFRKATVFAFVTSFVIYTLANFQVIHQDLYSYRLLPGVLFIFLFGALIYRTLVLKSFADKIFLYAGYIYLLVLVCVLFVSKRLGLGWSSETIMGLLLGIPLISKVTQSRNMGRTVAKFGKFAGEMSYAIFLTHFLGMWLTEFSLQHRNIRYTASQHILLSCFVTFVISYLLVLLVRLIEKIRVERSKARLM